MPSQRKVYFNGDYVPESEARVSIFDSALMFGDMVFEMTRTYNHKPFRLRHHLERLYAGIKTLEIDCGLTIDEMEEATLKTLEVNNPAFPEGLDIQIMHDVSRGPLGIYKSVFPEGIKPTVTINCWPLTYHLAGIADLYDTGVHAVTTVQRSVPSRLIDPKIKNRSRIFYQTAHMQAQRVEKGAYAVLTDEDGFLTEGTGSNIFLVKGDELFTPEGRNILRGVTRGAVMDVAAELGIPCHERNVEPYDVVTADEMFFTSTSMAVLPATRFNGLPVGDGTVGPMVRSLLDGFSEMVGVDIVAQAKQYKEEAGPGA
jgi:branched-chain amino acid aminotransferase